MKKILVACRPQRRLLTVVSLSNLATLALLLLIYFEAPLSFAAACTTAIATLVKLFGQPDQVLKLWRVKSAVGLSVLYNQLAYLSYGCWFVYGLRIHDHVIWIGQGLGVVGACVVYNLILVFKFGKRGTARLDFAPRMLEVEGRIIQLGLVHPTADLSYQYWLSHNHGKTWYRASPLEYLIARAAYHIEGTCTAKKNAHLQAMLEMDKENGIPSYWSALSESGGTITGCTTHGLRSKQGPKRRNIYSYLVMIPPIYPLVRP